MMIREYKERLVRPMYAFEDEKRISKDFTESKRGRIIVLREGFFYHAKGARVQRGSSTVMRVWKQRTNEHQTISKTGSR
ncbi:hypothetical protein TNCV_2332061 [Trichonephila clavipes]|nr:hypothetical protein TNCV_2332061 [Trichonephila clavipes]